MNITANTVVTLSYKLYAVSGELIEQSDAPITYLHGGHHGIFPKVEESLEEKGEGDVASVTLETDDAFGDYDAELVRVEPLDRFPTDVSIGMQFEGFSDEDDDAMQGIVYRVTDIAEGKVVVDGNHPLAGQRIRFDYTVLDVRPATADELEHGHAHGAHGHHH